MRQWICAAIILAAASCDDGAPQANVTRITVSENSVYQQRLAKMDPRLRNATFMRAIRDSGESCDRVVESHSLGLYKSLPAWSARCSGGSEWALFVAGDGGVQLRACAQTEQLGLPACRFGTTDDQSPSASNSSNG